MLGGSDDLIGAGGRSAVTGDRRTRGGEDLDVELAETGAQRDRLAGELGPDRVAIALEGDQRRA